MDFSIGSSGLTRNLAADVEAEAGLVLDDSDCFGLSNVIRRLASVLHRICLRDLVDKFRVLLN